MNYIRKIISSVKYDGSFNSWAHIANNDLVWYILINNIGQNDSHQSGYNSEWDGNIPESKSTTKIPPSFSSPFSKKSPPP